MNTYTIIVEIKIDKVKEFLDIINIWIAEFKVKLKLFKNGIVKPGTDKQSYLVELQENILPYYSFILGYRISSLNNK